MEQCTRVQTKPFIINNNNNYYVTTINKHGKENESKIVNFLSNNVQNQKPYYSSQY